MAVSRYGFDMLKYEALRTDFELTLIIGDGITEKSDRLYFDRVGAIMPLQNPALRNPQQLPVPEAIDHMVIHQTSRLKKSVSDSRSAKF